MPFRCGARRPCPDHATSYTRILISLVLRLSLNFLLKLVFVIYEVIRIVKRRLLPLNCNFQICHIFFPIFVLFDVCHSIYKHLLHLITVNLISVWLKVGQTAATWHSISISMSDFLHRGWVLTTDDHPSAAASKEFLCRHITPMKADMAFHLHIIKLFRRYMNTEHTLLRHSHLD